MCVWGGGGVLVCGGFVFCVEEGCLFVSKLKQITYTRSVALKSPLKALSESLTIKL